MYNFHKIREYSSVESLPIIQDSLLFYGEILDDRGTSIIEKLHVHYNQYVKVIYINSIDSFKIIENKNPEKILRRQEFYNYVQKKVITNNNISLESTTLGYTEILSILYALNKVQSELQIKIYYVEPDGYNKKESDSYDLSEEYSSHKYIKPFILPSPHDSIKPEEATLISFLGFEENRIGRVKYESENKYNRFISIFAVPGFKFGWENISIARHYMFLDNEKDIYYTPADDPYEAYKILKNITENFPDERIVIMPIGTKPCSIGTIVFLINTKELGNIERIACKYDFPKRKLDRSYGISKIYEYYLHKI